MTHMTEYIDKTEAMRRFADFGREIPKDIVIGVIASIKEEVVRCKDCKRRKICCRPCYTSEDSYCSDAERSEE